MTGTLVVAIMGLCLSVGSLTWQAASWVLSGGRIKVELRVGAIGEGGMVHAAPSEATRHMAESSASQGYTVPIVCVRVRSVGRLPVTITEWSIFESHKGMAFRPIGDSIGPTLPHRLEPGEEEVWAMEASNLQSLIEVTSETFNVAKSSIVVRGRIGTGTGKTYVTQQGIRGS